MLTAAPEETISTMNILKETDIAAPARAVWDAIMEQIGPGNQMPDGTPYPFVLEAWPGGRWFRDLGNKTGHLWGHVQVIKPPTLLEIIGPLMMSYPAMNHVQYRFKAEGDITRLLFTHRSFGLIQPQHREGLSEGWQAWLERIRDLAEHKQGKKG